MLDEKADLNLAPDRMSTSTDETGSHTEDGGEPTEHENATLRHIGDKIPYSAYLVAVVELAERFTYYGLTGPFRMT